MDESTADQNVDCADEFLAAAARPPGSFGMPGIRISFPDRPEKPELSLVRLEHLIEPRVFGQLLLEEIGPSGAPSPVRIRLQVDGNDFRGKDRWRARIELGDSDGRIYVRFNDFSALFKYSLEEEQHQPEKPVLEQGASFRGKTGTTYLVGKELGRGGTAIVHAVHSRKGPMAAKCLRPDRFPLTQLVPRFEREVDYLSQVRHPNLLRFVDRCMAGETLIMVTELARESLATRLQGEFPAPEEVTQWIAQILGGLAHLHERGITHRDLSPKNVLFDPQGNLKLADFGTARAATDPDLTNDISEMQLGSLLFISDQQRQDPHDAQAADDIFSVGQISYLLLTGTIPFGNPPDLAALGIVDPKVAEVIEAMRAHRRENRYANGGEALAALEATAR
jgi:serine/threonine protein kinase